MNPNFDSLKAAFQSIGFSELEVDKQLNEFAQLYVAIISEEAKSKYPEVSPTMSAEEVEKLIPKEDRVKILKVVNQKLTIPYLNEITQGLTEEQKASFYKKALGT